MGLLTDPGRSDKFAKLLISHHTKLSVVVYIVGLCWLFALVDDNFNLRVKISENALLPGLVQSGFATEDEGFAKKAYKTLIEQQKNGNGSFPADEIKDSFRKIGLDVYDHFYNFQNRSSADRTTVQQGRNIYAILRASRASSLESVVFAVPYRPASTKHIRTEGGIALLLALANQSKHKHYWAKDIIFLVTSNEHFGAKAWVEAYHGVSQASKKNFSDTPLRGRGGAIQAALVLEIPGSDIDYLDLRLVGLNGQMPNMDLFTLTRSLFGNQQIPLVIQGNAKLLDRYPEDFLGKYLRDLETAGKMVAAAASGALEGIHGFFQQCNIQSLSVRGLTRSGTGGRGKIGFRDLGITLEGICRSLNNLLERFHQSYFFYILPSATRFVSIGLYMPPLGLIVLPVVLRALALWAKGTSTDEPDKASVNSSTMGAILPWLLLAHGISFGTFFGHVYLGRDLGLTLGVSTFLAFSLPLLASRFMSRADADLLKSVNLIEMAVGLYALSMLNFSLALVIAIVSVPVAVWATAVTAHDSPIRLLNALLLFVSFPIVPLIGRSVCENWSDLLALVPHWESVIVHSLKGVSASFVEYSEYGNWLVPVAFLFLLPLWISNWVIFWV
ncbi:Glycosylphosphatidylinositol anchor attachment 1 protein [Hypsibius exemplaris]|uniref:Glycosylphosphatidylinositol anchor attachment 1 protein n=1 Tax=Hypsibius exemplaris TaxID=2072580 RepID=A0A1W0WMR0_HYPEX|nr:Glycosylphosphatidylinositol anchor attachment 1 protein [Hypsibius exemplaris]